MSATYFDSFAGLIPVELVRRFMSHDKHDMVELRVTRDRGPYAAGEVLEHMAHRYVHITRRTQYTNLVSTVPP